MLCVAVVISEDELCKIVDRDLCFAVESLTTDIDEPRSLTAAYVYLPCAAYHLFHGLRSLSTFPYFSHEISIQIFEATKINDFRTVEWDCHVFLRVAFIKTTLFVDFENCFTFLMFECV